jgi:hypothetical protein
MSKENIKQEILTLFKAKQHAKGLELILINARIKLLTNDLKQLQNEHTNV